MTSLQELLARKASLEAELARVNEAITAFGDATPVSIRTRRNLRNTWGVTTNPDRADEALMIFATRELAVPASKSSHDGYVLRSAWEAFKAENPDCLGFDGGIWED
jgi:hypothetical protein